jgi:hypothetical protein
VRNVAKHYEFLAGASQKAIDWSNLAVICIAIYGSKFHAARQRRSGDSGATPAAPSERRGEVVPLRQPVGVAAEGIFDLHAVEVPPNDGALL